MHKFVAVLSILLSSSTPFAIAQSATPAPSHSGSTLAKIEAANSLQCGVDFEEAEYSTEDAHGNHSAFDLGLCKAIAVAVLGPNAHFTAVPYRDESDAVAGLKSGAIDVLATASSNFINTASRGIAVTRPVLYDYQGFLVNKASNIHSTKDLAGKKICFISGTELEIQLQGYMQRQQVKWLPFPFQEEGEMEAAFITGNCAAVTADVTQLAYERIAFKSMARSFEILPDVVAKDPLSVAYRSDDPQWATVLDWLVASLIQAEESGITQANLPAMKQSTDPIIRRLLGTQHGYGQYLCLDDDWAARTIQAVGNYGELFDRTLGSGSPMRLDRGPNSLWTHGGLMIASPIR